MANLYSILGGGKFVELSKGKRLFKKQLIRFGDYVDPNGYDEGLILDYKLAQTLVENFNKGLIRVALPGIHTNDSTMNNGELVELMIEGDGLYGVLDIRREEVAQDIESDLIFDVSVSFNWNFQDTETGEYIGPTLTHVALVNDPYISGMNPFEMVSAALSRNKLESVMLSRSENKEKSMTSIKNTQEFEVTVTYKDGDKELSATLEPGGELEIADEQVEAVQKQIDEATAPEESKDDTDGDEGDAENAEEESQEEGEETANDASEEEEETEEESTEETEEEVEDKEETELSRSGQTDLARENAALKEKIAESEIESRYNDLLKKGKLVPAMKESFYALSREVNKTVNLSQDSNVGTLFTEFLEATPRIVKLSQEEGSDEAAVEEEKDALYTKEEKANLQAAGVSIGEDGKASLSMEELLKKDKE